MKKVRMGMVGGGNGSFIGAVHRAAARMDGLCELVCGAFSREEKNNLETGEALGLAPNRVYSDYQRMIKSESLLPESQRMDFVVIVTPNVTHWPIAKAALESGFHVMSEKPATFNLDECEQLFEVVSRSKCLYGLAHVYTGYPLVKEARNRILKGDLGKIRKIVIEYSQDWLAHVSCEDSKQAEWRLDPKQSGASCCVGDIGVHAANLAEYMTGMRISHVCADTDHIVAGRKLDDDANLLLKFDGHIKGILIASQVAIGEENNLHIRVYGDKASLEWRQQDPNVLLLKPWGQPKQVISSARQYLSASALSSCRIPTGHPEGYIEAFANLYRSYFDHLKACRKEPNLITANYDYPGIDEARRGMKFIDAVLRSGLSGSKWYEIPNYDD